MNYRQGFASKTGRAIRMRDLSVHAIDVEKRNPICTDTLVAVRIGSDKATVENVSCRSCLKKLNPLAIDYYKPVRIVREV